MSLSKKLSTGIKFLIISFSILGIFLLYVSGTFRQMSTVEIGLTPSTFQPVAISSASFTVRDINGKSLQVVDGTTALSHYHDSTGHYPDVDLLYSQPFLCYPDGNYKQTISQESNAITSSLYVDGKIYFLNEYYFRIDIGARTYQNMKNRFVNSVILNPLRGATVQYSPTWALGNVWTWKDPGTTYNPDGNLILGVNVGTSPWQYSHKGTQVAQIQGLLESQDFQVTSWNPVPRAGYTLADSINKLKTEWGNSPVIVQPNITITGRNDFIRYSYERQVTLSNGTKATVQVQTTSAIVGFTDAYKATQIEGKGLIPNAFDSAVNAKLQMKNDEQSPSPVTQGSTKSNSDDPGFILGSKSVDGHVKYLGDVQVAGSEAITGASNIYGSRDSLEGKQITIDLNDFNSPSLPRSVWNVMEFKLQPATTLKIAKTEVKYEVMFWNGIYQTFDSVVDGTSYIYYPYEISESNVYAIGSCVVKCVVLSENNPTIIVNGKPIDKSLITDFEIGSWGINPKINDIEDKFEIPVINIENIITIVVIVIVGIVVIFIILSFRKGGRTIINIGGRIRLK